MISNPNHRVAEINKRRNVNFVEQKDVDQGTRRPKQDMNTDGTGTDLHLDVNYGEMYAPRTLII